MSSAATTMWSGAEGRRPETALSGTTVALPAGRESRFCVVEFWAGGGAACRTTCFMPRPDTPTCSSMSEGKGWVAGRYPDRGGRGQSAVPGLHPWASWTPTYYYRRVITDGGRAVEAARRHPLVDPSRVAATGVVKVAAALAVAALVPDLVAAMPDVPFLCDFRRATHIATTGPYLELVSYLKVHRTAVSAVFDTLSYVDGVNFSARARCPALFSVALMDTTCPPSTVYAAYHHYAGPSQLDVFPFNGHEGGSSNVGATTLLAENRRCTRGSRGVGSGSPVECLRSRHAVRPAHQRDFCDNRKIYSRVGAMALSRETLANRSATP
jgi:cephalosporin-C deacetylase